MRAAYATRARRGHHPRLGAQQPPPWCSTGIHFVATPSFRPTMTTATVALPKAATASVMGPRWIATTGIERRRRREREAAEEGKGRNGSAGSHYLPPPSDHLGLVPSSILPDLYLRHSRRSTPGPRLLAPAPGQRGEGGEKKTEERRRAGGTTACGEGLLPGESQREGTECEMGSSGLERPAAVCVVA